jgi:hypothetical protein
MNRAEASEAIGKRVRAWTAANGVYVGTLREVRARHGAPWRGVVLVDGILEVAVHFERGGFGRRGYRPGETLEVGGQSIKLTTEAGFKTYEEALLGHIEFIRQAIERDPKGRDSGTLLMIGKGSQAALKAERARQAGGVWKMDAAALSI